MSHGDAILIILLSAGVLCGVVAMLLYIGIKGDFK